MPPESAGISRGWQHQRKIQPGTSTRTHERPLRRYHLPPPSTPPIPPPAKSTLCSREPLNLPSSAQPVSRSHNVCFHRGECKPIRAIASERARRTRAQSQYRLLQGERPSDSPRFRSSAGALSPSVSSTASHTRLLSPPRTRSRPQSTSTSARRSSSTRQRLPGHRRTRLRARVMDVSATIIWIQGREAGHAACSVRWF